MENTDSSHNSKHLNVWILQFGAVYKDKEKSIQKADELLKKYSLKNEIDIVVLPEMAFTGYKFKDKEDISPLLEVAGWGPTFEWWKKTAEKLQSYIFWGYPEKVVSGWVFQAP
jgi:protein N-terminal amidase